MNNKIMVGTAVMALLVTMASAWAGSGNAAFTIDIVVDTTISLPTLCETGVSTNANALDFEPGITGLDDPEAEAIDTCSNGVGGDWNVTMAGNVPLNLSFALDSAAPSGVTVSLNSDVGGEPSPFGDGTELNLTTTASMPSWAQDLTDASTLEIWQRVAATTDAVGGTSDSLLVEITSSYTP